MDENTRKLITIHQAMHPKDDINRLKKEPENSLALSISFDAAIQGLKEYTKKSKERQIMQPIVEIRHLVTAMGTEEQTEK